MVKKKNVTDASVPGFIDSAQGLKDAVNLLRQRPVLGVDLEADSMFHFKEKICLIQIADLNSVYIIDPLALNDLSPLKDLFANSGIKKVFHGADYDVRSLYRDFHIEIENLFDTELACRFLGMAQTSLEKVVLKYFDVTLDKTYQKKDWSQRPLPPQMVAYAAKDASYLIPLADNLSKELRRMKRLEWVLEECRLLSRVRPSEETAAPHYLNFKGAGKLAPKNLAVLENLLQYRTRLAEQYDRPLFKVIGNHSLLTLAHHTPTDAKALEKSRALSPRQMERHGAAILNLVRQALTLPRNELPVYPRGRAERHPAQVVHRIQALKAWKVGKAGELHVDPALVLNRAQMTAVATLQPARLKDLDTIAPLRRWQIKAFGRDIIEILEQACMK